MHLVGIIEVIAGSEAILNRRNNTSPHLIKT
jgi:hypothetical protein